MGIHYIGYLIFLYIVPFGISIEWPFSREYRLVKLHNSEFHNSKYDLSESNNDL